MRLRRAIQEIKYLVYSHPSNKLGQSGRNKEMRKNKYKQKMLRVMKDTNLQMEWAYDQVLSRINGVGENPQLNTS